MLEKELQEINNRDNAVKNLKYSLLSLGFLILSAIVFFITVDSFHPGRNKAMGWILVILFYGLTILAAVVATVAFKNSFNAIKTYKNNKNYIALAISIVVLLAMLNQMYQRL